MILELTKCAIKGCNNPTTEHLKAKIEGKEVPVCVTCWNKLKLKKRI